MKTRAATEYVLLGALFSGPRHGYEIISFLEQSLGRSWYVGTSQLYTVLKRLEKDGLVKSWVKHQETRPSKRIFSITRKGEERFKEWTSRPSEHVRDLRVEFLAKLYFIKTHDFPWGEKLVEEQARVLRERRATLMSLRRREKDQYHLLVYSLKLATVRSWLTWLEKEARKFVKEGGL